MAKRAHRPPSRERYDASHPVVSVRVSPELKTKLDEIRDQTGKSYGDVLREAADVQEESTGIAYEQGWHDAQEKYAVTCPCSVCGETIWVQSKAERRAIAGYMKELGWHHSGCR